MKKQIIITFEIPDEKVKEKPVIEFEQGDSNLNEYEKHIFKSKITNEKILENMINKILVIFDVPFILFDIIDFEYSDYLDYLDEEDLSQLDINWNYKIKDLK